MVTYSYGKDSRGYVVLGTKITSDGKVYRREISVYKTEKAAANYCAKANNPRKGR